MGLNGYRDAGLRTVWVKKSPCAACGFLSCFVKRLKILTHFLHICYTFVSTLDCKFLFSYLEL